MRELGKEHGAGWLDRTALEEQLAGRHKTVKGWKALVDRDVQRAVQDHPQCTIGVVLAD